jgi:uncharacterized membrane protein YsdA (DUF1294 family)
VTLPDTPLLVLAVYAVASVITFAAYGLDKSAAARGGRRISERTLHVLAFAGGWPGALAGQRVFRHKTQKLSFRVVLWAIVALHVAALAWWMSSANVTSTR